MRNSSRKITCLVAGFMAVVFVVGGAMAAPWPNPKTYTPSIDQINKHKARFDDPRPLLKSFGPDKVLPTAMYQSMCYDVETMKKVWSQAVGLRAPELVGKIAPDIKPGKYTYKDVQNNPKFKELMPDLLYKRIKPGAPPHIGNIPEFEIVPTRQYYWALPVAEMTLKNAGRAKLDDKGYLVLSSWEGGYPFPKPSGKFKAQQIMQNVEKRYVNFDLTGWQWSQTYGFNRDLKQDYSSGYTVKLNAFVGRVYDPTGWYDSRAKERGEMRGNLLNFLSPRDMAGGAYTSFYYLDPNKPDQVMMYIAAIRRAKKMSSTDTQDPLPGADQCYDDQEGFMQRLSPTRYPFEMRIVAEREYLVPAVSDDGSEYVTSKGGEYRNVKLERRPIYVIELKQLDKNYIYGKRIFYVDQETFNFYSVENYDQKGRLYRTWDNTLGWFPKMGMFAWTGNTIIQRDYIDLHSTFWQPYTLPARWNRSDLSLEGLLRAK
jgi:hypothetical protein